MPVPFKIVCRLLKFLINYPARYPTDSRIGLLTFGTVPVRNRLSRCLRQNPHNCRKISWLCHVSY